MAIGAVLALPTAAAALGITLASWVFIACKVAVATSILLVGIAFRYRLYYDLSLFYNVWIRQPQWWQKISSDVVLGALPLIHHVDQLKALGVTHIVSLVEDFELKQGIVRAATKDVWEQHGIEYIHTPTKDYHAVPIETIGKAIDSMEEIRKTNPNAKFYIHCKAGRGRSATVVVADRLRSKIDKQPRAELEELIRQEVALVKAIRPEINLQSKQQRAILTYCESLRH